MEKTSKGVHGGSGIAVFRGFGVSDVGTGG